MLTLYAFIAVKKFIHSVFIHECNHKNIMFIHESDLYLIYSVFIDNRKKNPSYAQFTSILQYLAIYKYNNLMFQDKHKIKHSQYLYLIPPPTVTVYFPALFSENWPIKLTGVH